MAQGVGDYFSKQTALQYPPASRTCVYPTQPPERPPSAALRSPQCGDMERGLPDLRGFHPQAGGRQPYSGCCAIASVPFTSPSALLHLQGTAPVAAATRCCVRCASCSDQRLCTLRQQPTWLQNSTGTPASTNARMPSGRLSLACVRMDSGRNGSGCAIAAGTAGGRAAAPCLVQGRHAGRHAA